MRVELGVPLGQEAGTLKPIKHDSWWRGFCLDNSPLSKFLSLPGPPACPVTTPSCQAYFINGSSWTSFSGIRGLLPFGVLRSPDARNTGMAPLETITTTQPGTVGPRWLDPGSTPGCYPGWGSTKAGRQKPEGLAQLSSAQDTVNREMVFWALHKDCFQGISAGMICPPFRGWIWISDQPECLPTAVM